VKRRFSAKMRHERASDFFHLLQFDSPIVAGD
jgi:hypothetical protein